MNRHSTLQVFEIYPEINAHILSWISQLSFFFCRGVKTALVFIRREYYLLVLLYPASSQLYATTTHLSSKSLPL